MPLELWYLPGFATTMLTGLAFHAWYVPRYRICLFHIKPPGRWGTFVYYIVLIAQDVLGLSALQTGVRMIPFSVQGMYLASETTSL